MQKSQRFAAFLHFNLSYFFLLSALYFLLLFVPDGIALAQETAGLALQAPSLSLPIIIGFGLIDSINPCVIGVLLLMLAMLLKTGDRTAILKNGAAYVVGVYVTYLIGGITLLGLFNAIRSVVIIGQLFYFVIGVFVLIAGLLEVKDYFWYGKWFSLAIPHRFITLVEDKVTGIKASLVATFGFGAIVTLVELPCTGAPYLAILTLMSQGGYGYIKALPLLLLYNLVFIVPLAVIIYLAYAGIRLKALESWRQEQRGIMRLVIGVALLAVAVWILTTVADYLLWPLGAGLLAMIGLMALVKSLQDHKVFEHKRHRAISVKIAKVEKRSGREAEFDVDRLVKSISRVLHEVDQGGTALAEDLAHEVVDNLHKTAKDGRATALMIRHAVLAVFAKHGLQQAKAAYLRHRYH